MLLLSFTAAALALGACGSGDADEVGLRSIDTIIGETTLTTSTPGTDPTTTGPDLDDPGLPDEAVPSRAPDFTGVIDSVQPLPATAECTPGYDDPAQDPDAAVSSDDPIRCPPATDVLGTALVGEDVVASITAATRIWGCDQNDALVPMAFEELAALTGQPASLWVDGPVAESYPMQATAASLTVGSCG